MTPNWKSAIRYMGGSPKTENKIILKMEKDIRKVVENHKAENHGIALRAQHAKMTVGIENALFMVDNSIPQDLQYGFLKPGSSHLTLLRFSNASGIISHNDSKPGDLRGMAVKIKTDIGSDQDFLMTNSEKHFGKNAKEAISISIAFSKGSKIKGIANLVFLVGPLRAIAILTRITSQIKTPVESVATETYWSRAPIRIGEVVLKYRMFPAIEKITPNTSTENLKQELTTRLSKSDIHYYFQVQRYIDEKTTPLEDSTIAWKSKFETIAHLTIPKQELAENENFIDKLTFNPWNINSTDFEPVGNMNRARKRVYPSSVMARH